MPTISIVIPAYNAAETILETVRSIQEQTYTDFEVIVIDDGSTDKTVDILKTLKDQRIKIFSFENSGVSAARNRGINHACGEFITFLDADDLWSPDKLELQVKALYASPKASVVYSWTSFMNRDCSKSYGVEKLSYRGDVYAEMLLRNFLASGSNIMTYRHIAESVGGFDTSLPQSEDWDFYLRLAAKYEFEVVQKPQIFYRQSSNSMSSDLSSLEQSALLTIRKAFQSAPNELKDLESLTLANFYQFLARSSLVRNGNDREIFKESFTYLKRAIAHQPSVLLRKSTTALMVKLAFKKLGQLL